MSYSPNEYSGLLLDHPIACSVDGSSSYNNSYQWINIIDNTTGDYGYIKPGQVMEINFGKVVNLTSFYVNSYSSSNAATGLKLETSTDGSKWNNWGEVSYEKSSSYYINLSAAEDVQYMRIVFTGGGDSDKVIDIDGLAFYGNK